MINPGFNEIISTRVIIENGHDIALLRRANTREFKGVWELPGGKVDQGESLITAASREALEETGLDIEMLTLQPRLVDEREISDGKHRGKDYVSYGFVALTASREIKLERKGDHVESMWLPAANALELPLLSQTSQNAIRKLAAVLRYGI